MLSSLASAMPVTRFVAPGPLVAMHTPILPGGSGDSLSRKAAALFVPGQNRADLVALFAQGLMQRHAASAGVGVNRIRSQPNEHLDQNLGTVHCLSCFFNGSQRRDFHYRVFRTRTAMAARYFFNSSIRRFPGAFQAKRARHRRRFYNNRRPDINIHPPEFRRPTDAVSHGNAAPAGGSRTISTPVTSLCPLIF